MKSRLSKGPELIGWDKQPDLDLHVFCGDGRHVGVDYETGEYEVGIEGAITNGDNLGAPEWVFFPPEGNESCRHVVSGADNAAFLAANPDVASQLPDVTDTYEIYSRVIDPASGIFTSATLAGSIEPGGAVQHGMTTDPSGQPTIHEGAVDVTPPVTSYQVDGTPSADGWHPATVAVTLSAADSGSGVTLTEWSLDSGATWTEYSEPVALGEGEHSLKFHSTDLAGNVEAAQEIEIRVDLTPPALTIDAPADGATLSGPQLDVYVTASDALSGVLSVSRSGADCLPLPDPSAWMCPVTLVEGPNLVEVTAADLAGNVAAASVSVTLVTDADSDGVPDSEDACPATWGQSGWRGCPSAAQVRFRRHAVGAGTRPGSAKETVPGAEVRAFSLEPGSCADSVGANPHEYGTVRETCAAESSALTDSSGEALLGLPPGAYLLVAKDPQTSVYAGVRSGDLDPGDLADKFLQVIVRADGSSVPAKTTKRTGSLLYIIEPEYIEWDGATELYPFVLDSEGDWGVTVTVEPPEGFTADHDELSEDVSDEYGALQFELTDVGSCWECGTSFEIRIDHKGRSETVRRNVPTPMAEAFVRAKGLTRSEMEARGVTVTKPGRAQLRGLEAARARSGR
jgi:hypothetical protein